MPYCGNHGEHCHLDREMKTQEIKRRFKVLQRKKERYAEKIERWQDQVDVISNLQQVLCNELYRRGAE